MKPYLRVIRDQLQLRAAQLRVTLPTQGGHRTDADMGFVVGCGRSGTTILGKLLSAHPQIAYVFEPWHLWRVVDSRTDVAYIFGATEANMLMGAEMCTAEARRRFRRLILQSTPSQGQRCIEKTAHNAMRIGYIERLSPGARYIHIVRDGLDVVSSIARLAETNLYKLGFRKNFNQWWGENDSKWNALKRDGAAAGYFPDEVSLLHGQLERAAYEWLVSLSEIERHRAKLGDRLHELRYVDLVADPGHSLQRICHFLAIDVDQRWMHRAVGMIQGGTRKGGLNLTLPPKMEAAFNAHQEHFGFSGRAVAR